MKVWPDFQSLLPAHGVSCVVPGMLIFWLPEYSSVDQAKLYCSIRSRTIRVVSGGHLKESFTKRLYLPHSSLMNSGEAFVACATGRHACGDCSELMKGRSEVAAYHRCPAQVLNVEITRDVGRNFKRNSIGGSWLLRSLSERLGSETVGYGRPSNPTRDALRFQKSRLAGGLTGFQAWFLVIIVKSVVLGHCAEDSIVWLWKRLGRTQSLYRLSPRRLKNK